MARPTLYALLVLLVPCSPLDRLEGVGEPGVIQWGASVEEMKARLANRCAKLNFRTINPPFLTDVRHQQQIDCEGFEFYGGLRRAEFVIGDNSLEMVWILIEPAELPSARAGMTKTYGQPTAQREEMVGWPERRTALNAKPAEFLFYSPRQAAEWATWYTEARRNSRP